MLTVVSGNFVKIAYASDANIHLQQGHARRPAARFNRPGQNALYLSPDEESARIAIGEYVQKSDPPRVLIQYEVERCVLFDLRHPNAKELYALACQPWQKILAGGGEPASWHAADHIRKSGHVGLIDPSRRRPGLWHITLLQWNVPGAPEVKQLETPKPISLTLNYR